MADTIIRPATRADLPRLTELYNYYIINTPITFDLEPYTIETRTPWFDEHSDIGRHRMIVAVEDGTVIGYATQQPLSQQGCLQSHCRVERLLRARSDRPRHRIDAVPRALRHPRD